MNFNKVILAGNLTRDPEVKFATSGTAICSAGLAINRTWKSETGEKKTEATFIDVKAFGKTGENLGQYFKKGSSIFLTGRLHLEQWDDKQTGQKRSKIVVIVEEWQFVDTKNDSTPTGASAPRTAAQTRPAPDTETEPPTDDDDPPF